MGTKNKLFIISGPSGAGKSTLVNKLTKRLKNIVLSVSVTTRKRRLGEREGKDYYFVSEEEFKEKIRRGEFLEWAVVHGHYYGTLSSLVNKALSQNKDVILEIDVQGAIQVKKKMPESILIFILPPTIEVLKERLKKRKTEDKKAFRLRIENALKEVKEKYRYEYAIINDDLGKATDELVKVFKSVRKGKNC